MAPTGADRPATAASPLATRTANHAVLRLNGPRRSLTKKQPSLPHRRPRLQPSLDRADFLRAQRLGGGQTCFNRWTCTAVVRSTWDNRSRLRHPQTVAKHQQQQTAVTGRVAALFRRRQQPLHLPLSLNGCVRASYCLLLHFPERQRINDLLRDTLENSGRNDTIGPVRRFVSPPVHLLLHFASRRVLPYNFTFGVMRKPHNH